MSERRSALVLGGSSGVGRALADELAGAGYDVIVSARRARDLDAVAADLELRYGVSVTALPVDLCGTDAELTDYVERCRHRHPDLEAVLVPAGMIGDPDDGTSDWALATALVTTNFLGVMKVAGEFLRTFEDQGRGTLVLFSSIAAAAPRSRNVAYAAAKAALETYGRSMQHRFAGTDVRVQVYALGYVDTAMAQGQRLLLPPTSPSRVARVVVAHLGDDRRVRYLPAYWRGIVFVLRRLPWVLYRRLRF